MNTTNHVQTITHGNIGGTPTYYYRCCSCGFEGPPRRSMSEAIEDACPNFYGDYDEAIGARDFLRLEVARLKKEVTALQANARRLFVSDEDFTDCDTCGQLRPRCAAIGPSGERCNSPDRPHLRHTGNSSGWSTP